MRSGVLVVDKPAGMSSAGTVEKVKRAVRAKRAGHAGTLDPIATGVLPICLDEATKIAAYILAEDKEYIADAVLGIETDTLDRTGQVIATRDISHVTRAQLEAAIAARLGEQDQVPPMYSAIKQGGVRLYRKARAGEEVVREPRRVRIDRLELLAWEPPRMRLAIACSKGTYVRSIVADIGADVGSCAHLAELRRTRTGQFRIEDAQPLSALDRTKLVPIRSVLAMPAWPVPPETVPLVRSGVQLKVDKSPTIPATGQQFQMVVEDGQLLAIAHVELGKVIYDRVFHLDGSGDLPQSPR